MRKERQQNLTVKEYNDLFLDDMERRLKLAIERLDMAEAGLKKVKNNMLEAKVYMEACGEAISDFNKATERMI